MPEETGIDMDVTVFKSGADDTVPDFSDIFEETKHTMEYKALTSLKDSYSEEAGTYNEWLEPPYDPAYLTLFVEQSPDIPDCIQAYINHIECQGFDIEPAVSIPEEGGEALINEINRQKKIVQDFFNNINYNKNYTQLREERRQNYEEVGYAFVEVIRNDDTELYEYGNVSGIEVVPSSTMKLGIKTDKVEKKWTRWYVDDNGNPQKDEDNSEWVYYRKFKHEDVLGGKKVYFKEFGDPRPMDRETGDYLPEDHDRPPEQLATEIIYFRQYSSRCSHGIPRWIGAYFPADGSQKSWRLDKEYLDNSAISPMLMMIDNGRLTKKTHERLKKALKRKDGEAWKIILVESAAQEHAKATGDGLASATSIANARIHIEKLMDTILKDATHLDYKELCSKIIRTKFNVPAALVGRSEDHSRASVEAAKQTFEENVGRAERQRYDETINRTIIRDLQCNLVKHVTRKPKIQKDVSTVVPLMKEALSINEIKRFIAQYTATEYEHINEDWANIPLSILKDSSHPLTIRSFGELESEGTAKSRLKSMYKQASLLLAVLDDLKGGMEEYDPSEHDDTEL